MADLINGLLEAVGAYLVFLNVRQLHRDKVLMGVRWEPMLFFTGWGFWNCYYYPSLEQWASFTGGALLALVNLVWLGQALMEAMETTRAKRPEL
jgi:hypothetical protein